MLWKRIPARFQVISGFNPHVFNFTMKREDLVKIVGEPDVNSVKIENWDFEIEGERVSLWVYQFKGEETRYRISCKIRAWMEYLAYWITFRGEIPTKRRRALIKSALETT